MYLRKCPNKKTGRVQLDIVQAYRDKDGKSKHKSVLHIGYLDLAEKQYPDPIAHFTEVARQMTAEYKEQTKPVHIEFYLKQAMEKSYDECKNFGYAALSKIYHELDIKSFLGNRQRSVKTDFNLNSIFRLLVFSRLLYPASKKHTYENRNRFFERSDFSLDDVYRSLGAFAKVKDGLILHLHNRLKAAYGRDTSMVYYDVTNYYFEIDEQDRLRRKGVSKEHRPDPIVQMGLFMDANGLPITYGLYPGNMLDKQTFIPMMDRIQDNFQLKRVIYVADKGMTCGDNIGQILMDKNGYVFSYSIRGANKEFKDFVLDQSGYKFNADHSFKLKSRIYPREITVTTVTGQKRRIAIDEKQVVFYSEKFAEKARRDRAAALQKAEELIKSPAKYNRATAYGAAKYVKGIVFDPKTGEVLTKAKKSLSLDLDLLREEEKYDGYYGLVTSELDELDQKVIDIYRGLWKIEESFKVTKSEFETRPVYLTREEHIEAHFLICFTALLIARILEYVMKSKYSVGTLLDSLKKANCFRLEQNYYVFNYYDQVLADIGQALGLDFSLKYRCLSDIKKILGEVKK
jgi:transposase